MVNQKKTPGIAYVAISRVKTLSSLVIEPMTFQRLTSMKLSPTLQYRLAEENRLHHMAELTASAIQNNTQLINTQPQ